MLNKGRELIIECYLLFFKIVFSLFNLFPVKEKLTFVITFGDNSRYVYDEIIKQKIPVDVVILCKGAGSYYFEGAEEITLIPLESRNVLHFFKTVYHLATSRYVLIDNYFGFLAAVKFKKNVECIQLWHASGAIKKFGLEDQSIRNRSKRARDRFKKVYRNFHKVVVGSDIMADIFMKAFDLTRKNILYTGIPRTDFFYNDGLKREIIEKFELNYPELMQKKRILYTPTYRDGELDVFELKLDLKQMKYDLGNDYVILLRLHPAIKKAVNYSQVYSDFVYDFSSQKYDINELLLIADYLITDYSSIPYEFSILNKPMIFFAYDLESYQNERGLWDQYDKMVPGQVVKSNEEIISLVNENSFDMARISEYASEWNKYSNGDSSKNLVNYMFKNH